MRALRPLLASLCLFLLLHGHAFSQLQLLDNMESVAGWEPIRADGVLVSVDNDMGKNGRAIRMDYKFEKGTGYGGIQKQIPIDLPDNYEFTFWIKAQSPSNSFEIKFIDSTGHNVWWVNNRNYQFPGEWEKIRIKKRHIEFAWGPTPNKNLTHVDRIEFTVASTVGMQGTLWIDDLTFEPLEPLPESYPAPKVSANSKKMSVAASMAIDGNPNTHWESNNDKPQRFTIDFTTQREFGGLRIDWFEPQLACDFEVLISDNGTDWEMVYFLKENHNHQNYIRLPECETRYVRLNLQKSKSGNGFGIREIAILDTEASDLPNHFFEYLAQQWPLGDLPRYFTGQASYWTITGANNDTREALLNEDGAIEVERGRFSIEPMIWVGNKLFNWGNVEATQSMGFRLGSAEIPFTPSVHWLCDGIEFQIGISSGGEANMNSTLMIGYHFKNPTEQAKSFDFHLLIRPFQVNPSYQFLNQTGGVGKIHSIGEEEKGRAVRVDDKRIYATVPFNSFSTATFDQGNAIDFIRKGVALPQTQTNDPQGLANGLITYSLSLKAGEEQLLFLTIPFHEKSHLNSSASNSTVKNEFQKSAAFWANKVGHIRFNLPQSAQKMVDTYRSNLMYILINRDLAGIQPGSRSYERSWIRDGSLTSSALLKSGIVTEVKDFISWYAPFQYENGKVPCVVDGRGPDPVPENDSHGQLIYLIREYFNFTHDTAFLRLMNHHVVKAVSYIEELVAQRSTEYFRHGNDSTRAFYGIVPESISHEGYSEKPMHSFWDNFFTLKGLKDAAEIQRVLGETENYSHITTVLQTYRENLYNSISLAMGQHGIDYIPGCVELGDFDPTSTTIALNPCNEFANLPKTELYNTFDKYFEFFTARRDGTLDWKDYTPYENRIIGSFVFLNQPQRAHQLLDFFLNDQRPQAWNHWAEIVWNGYRLPRFIGDMPHTWIGSDYINAIRSMFVYENELDSTLVVASALRQEWIDDPNGISIENLPTFYGEISLYVRKENDKYNISITGAARLPINGIRIKNFNGGKQPLRVLINGRKQNDFSADEIIVNSIPAQIEVFYP